MSKFIVTLQSGTRGVLRRQEAPSRPDAVAVLRQFVDDVATIEAEGRWLPVEAIVLKVEQDDGGTPS